MSTIKLDFRDVSKVFDAKDRQVIALQGVDMQIETGEFVTIVGPSGCGKSTLLMIAAGLETTTEGAVFVDGRPVDGPSPDRGVIFQQYALFPWLTVRQNVEFSPRVRRLPDERRRAIVDHYLELVGLIDCANSLPKTLSGGMKQRCAIARAYAAEPALLLMDEPFGALDALTRTRMQQQLLNAWYLEPITVLFVTHDVEEAVFLGNRIVVMSARPGSITRIIPVRLPERRRQEDRLLPEFTAIRNEVWAAVYESELADKEPVGRVTAEV
jgi:NitT/TauT family transport system ATP-binding protein